MLQALMYKKAKYLTIDTLLSNEIITEFEASNLTLGTRIPCFYGLPKIHKLFDHFPPLRPICSGYYSSTAKISEFVDAFLKPAAQHSSSYVRDTLDFIRKLETQVPIHINANNSFLVSMDVVSLYPNIDHEEGISACEEALNKRPSQYVPTSVLSDFIKTVLQCNTLEFNGKYYHQIKGTAMGTPMAINFANIFMSKFEKHMIRDFFELYGKRPIIWLRYIDDIFFIWNDSEESLKLFINFCNSYAADNKIKSSIKFTVHYSKSEVVFLDTKVKFTDDKVVTTLFCKPSASHQYLHCSS